MASLDTPELLRCDYLVGMQDGKVVEEGSPSELLVDPTSRISKIVDVLVPDTLIEDRRNLLHEKMASLSL